MPGAPRPLRGQAPQSSDGAPSAESSRPGSRSPAPRRGELRWGEWLVVCLLVAGLVAADLATKALAQKHLGGVSGRSLVVIPGVLSFTYRENSGGPFSLLAGSQWSWVLGPLAALATVAVVWWLLSSAGRSRFELAACAAIVAGALGNLIDRFRFQAVRDFINLTCIHWPVFNLADAFICIGVALLLWHLLSTHHEAAPPEQV